ASDQTGSRGRLALVTRDRDALQTDQIHWGLDREQLLAEQGRLRERVSSLEADMATERTGHQALQARHAELTEQSNKLASDWAGRRQALAAELAAQNEEMEQVRKSLLESQERERRFVSTGPANLPTRAATTEQSHLINSRLNTLVGFSSVLLDERAHALTSEARRDDVKPLHDTAITLGATVRALTGVRPASADPAAPPIARDRRPPDILAADNHP